MFAVKHGWNTSPRAAGESNFFNVMLPAKVATAICALATLTLTGCDRMVTPRSSQMVKDADAKATEGDFAGAIALYETALDGTQKSADIHYRMALLYDDKMSDPLNALHHFKRYLALAPTGVHANDAKNFMKRDELTLVTNLSGDAVVSRGEASRLKNENLTLRKELEDQRAHAKAAVPAQPTRADKLAAAKKPAKNARSYVVRRGDTLASISRRFYKTSSHWKRILDANSKVVDDAQNLKVGETLTIP